MLDRSAGCLYEALGLRQVQAAAAKQSHESDNDQIDRDDIVQQSRHHKDQNAGDQRHEWSNTQMEIHRYPRLRSTGHMGPPRLDARRSSKGDPYVCAHLRGIF